MVVWDQCPLKGQLRGVESMGVREGERGQERTREWEKGRKGEREVKWWQTRRPV